MYLYYVRGPPAMLKAFWKILGRVRGNGFLAAPLPNAGPWPSGLRHPIYNRGERVSARSGGPNPSGPANMVAFACEEEHRRGDHC